MEKEKTFTPCKVGQILPAFGFMYRVIEVNETEVRMQVCGVSKSGQKRGYKVNYEKNDPTRLKEW